MWGNGTYHLVSCHFCALLSYMYVRMLDLYCMIVFAFLFIVHVFLYYFCYFHCIYIFSVM